ncbi:MAG: hypothetical protein JWR38_4342 [Mucilaginibacter sp.]|nr:hypothetical protein [Mucilaginibacter sp.]
MNKLLNLIDWCAYTVLSNEVRGEILDKWQT